MPATTQTAPHLDRARSGFGSPAWLAAAATLEEPPAGHDTVALRLVVTVTTTDATTEEALGAAELDLRVDLDGGRLAVRPATGPEPGLVVRAPAAAAAALLFGPSAARVGLTERGDVTIEGNFSLLFFIDSALEEDRAGHLGFLRRAAGFAAPAPAPPPTFGPEVASERSEEAARLGRAREVLPRTLAELDREVGSSTPGAQLYVSQDGHTLVDVGLGHARPGVEMTHHSWALWYCCAKPLLSLALAQLADRGLFDPHRPVGDYLPEFTSGGKDMITSAQLLTHTGPVPTRADPLHGVLAADDAERHRRAYGLRLLPSGRPAGCAINYSQWWAWYVLADLVAAIDGRDYEQYVESEILAPAGMDRTRLRLTPEEFDAVGDRLPLIHVVNTSGPPVPTEWWSTRAAATVLIPGVNTRGPVRDQGRFLEVLLAGGRARGGSPVLSERGVGEITGRHRTGLQDKFGNADWGLGLRLECNQLGEEFTSFSHHASPRAFGHEGLWTAVCFADPEAGLAVAVHLNGKVEHPRHRDRILRIGDAVYADLGLAAS